MDNSFQVLKTKEVDAIKLATGTPRAQSSPAPYPAWCAGFFLPTVCSRMPSYHSGTLCAHGKAFSGPSRWPVLASTKQRPVFQNSKRMFFCLEHTVSAPQRGSSVPKSTSSCLPPPPERCIWLIWLSKSGFCTLTASHFVCL